MSSRKIELVTQEILSARLPLSAAILRAERSLLNAQLGNFEAATEEIESIRSMLRTPENAALSAWLNLAEGAVFFYRGDRLSSRDKIERAVALSSISQERNILSLTLAWRAQLDLEFDELDRMIDSISAGLVACDESSDWSRSRLYSLIGMCFSYSGDAARARDYFGRSRNCAIRRGDDVMQSTIIWNIVASTADVYRVEELYVPEWREDMRRLWLFNESSVNFDGALGAVALWWFPRMIRAELLAREERFLEALELYEEILELYIQNDRASQESMLRADISWCLFKLGRSEEALAEARRSESATHVLSHSDDKAVTYGRLARAFGALGLADASTKYYTLGSEAWNILVREREWLRSELSTLVHEIT